jgi:hypothetical protein
VVPDSPRISTDCQKWFGSKGPILPFIDRRLREHLLPASVCVAALLVLGLAPYFVCWLAGYGFTCPTQGDVPYYVQLAAQPYYSHALYLSDPMVPGGASFYPWLQYIPFVYLTRWLGLQVFWIQILWTIAAALGTGLTLYLFLWLVFRKKWLAAGITICVWADIDLGWSKFVYRFLFVHQIYLVASDFVSHLLGHSLLARPVFPYQGRLTNPALDLPFLFLQLVVTSITRERPSRNSLILSGLVFALTFYVYFYLWTMIAAGLCLAMLIDRPGRRTYAWTLVLGGVLGWPQIAHDYLVRSALSAEGLRYFGLMSPSSPSLRNSPYAHPYLVIGELVILGYWITGQRRPALLLAWCMCCAGVCLSWAYLVTIYMHNYHWAWLVTPLMHIVVVAVVLDLIMLWKPRPHVPGWVYALLVTAYLASGIYLAASITLVGSHRYDNLKTIYSEYNQQRLVPGVRSLLPDSVIAGDAAFVDLAAAAERQRPLAGDFLRINMILGDEQRRTRFVLDQYLSGINRNSLASLMDDYGPAIFPNEEVPAYLHTFDDVSRDPDTSIDDLKVRYLVLPEAQPTPTFLSHRWNLIQQGPYWKIWERVGSGAERNNDSGTVRK